MSSRFRSALATVASAPWRRAPGLLRRRPGMVATVAGAAALLAAPVAAVPLFVSSAGTESVAVQRSERCPRDTGATYQHVANPQLLADDAPDPLAPLDGLGPTTRWALIDSVELVGSDASDPTGMAVVSRDGALDHVERVDGEPGAPGLWLSDRGAEAAGVGVGDTATVDGQRLPVAGIYRDLAGVSVDDYWCAHTDRLLLQGALREDPPPVALVDRPTFARLSDGLGLGAAVTAWEAPLAPGLTLAEADDLVSQLACREGNAADLEWCEGGRPRDEPNATPAPRAGGPVPGAVGAPTGPGRGADEATADQPDPQADARFVTNTFHTSLPFVTQRGRAIQSSVRGGVWPVAGLAALAGVGFVGAAASLWADSRRRELRLLAVRGVSPAGLGLKAVMETAIPLAVGAAAGGALAYGLVAWLGPSPEIEPSAVVRAAVGALGALAVALLTAGAVVAGRVAGGREQAVRTRRSWVGLVPWELGLAALTVVSYRRLGEWGVPVSRGADVSQVDVLGLLFPVLFLVTGVAVVVRLLFLGLRPLLRASRGWPVAAYLAVRRVARYRVAVLGLVAASALAAGVLGYAATLDRSLDASLRAKASTFVGSDVALAMAPDAEVPAALRDRSTEVDVYRRAFVEDDRREGVGLVAVDPATFARAAFWDASYADASLDELLDLLAAPPLDGRVPALLVGADGVPDVADAGVSGAGTTDFTIEQVAEVEAFPGMKRGVPTLVVAADALADLGSDRPGREVWVAGDRDDTLATLQRAGVDYVEARTFADTADQASFLTVSWTFGFMQSLGVAAAVLALGGTAAYLDTRRRGRVLGYAFARRMGLTRRQHRRALAVELVATVGVGCWLGLGIALTGAALATRRIDPVPEFEPGTLLRPAIALVVALAALALAAAAVAAALAQRRTDRDDPVEVLRAGA